MDSQFSSPNASLFTASSLRADSVRDRADEVLVAIAVLGLVATIADGDADIREIETFTREFGRRFVLSRRQSIRIVGLALQKVQTARGLELLDTACDTVNEHLDESQKLWLFEALTDVLIADGQVDEREEIYLDYIVGKLGLMRHLERRPSSEKTR